jgi:nitrogen regulatory protein P-II 1
MKKVEAVIQACKVDELREALATEKLPRITIFEVKGVGTSQGRVKQYRGCRYIEESVDVKIEFVTDDDEAERIAESIVATLRNGGLCDGEVIVVPIEQHFRQRVGRGEPANWKQDLRASYLERDATSFRSHLETLRRTFHEGIQITIKVLLAPIARRRLMRLGRRHG